MLLSIMLNNITNVHHLCTSLM